MTDDEAVEVLYRKAIAELEDDEQPLRPADRERVRAFVKDGFRPGMGAAETAALQAAAEQDLLQALESEPGDPVGDLRLAVAGLGEIIIEIRRARTTAKTGS